MFEPMTARPVPPSCAVPVLEFGWEPDELIFWPLNLANFSEKLSVTLWHSERSVARGDRLSAASDVEQALQLGEPRHGQRDGGHHQDGRRGQVRGRRHHDAVAA